MTVVLLCLVTASSMLASVARPAEAEGFTSISVYVPVPGGTVTSTSEPFTGLDYTAAFSHVENGVEYGYPIGSLLRVTHHTELSVIVRVNDCTPYTYTGDLSMSAMQAIGGEYEGRLYPDDYTIEVLAYGDGYDPWSAWCRYYGC